MANTRLNFGGSYSGQSFGGFEYTPNNEYIQVLDPKFPTKSPRGGKYAHYAVYVGTGGTLKVETADEDIINLVVGDNQFVPIRVTRVMLGTSAGNIVVLR